MVGVQKYVYDIFGPGVNLAARLEPLCGPMEILVSEDTYRLIKNDFRITDRGEHGRVEAKLLVEVSAPGEHAVPQKTAGERGPDQDHRREDPET